MKEITFESCLIKLDSAKAEFSDLLRRHADLMEQYEFAGCDLRRFGTSSIRDQFCSLEQDLMNQIQAKAQEIWKLRKTTDFIAGAFLPQLKGKPK